MLTSTVARPAPWNLAALSLSMLLAALGTSIVNVGLPALAQAFGASYREVQWVVISYLLVITALVVVAGRLGDLVGRRRLLLAGVSLFTLASLLCALAPSLGWLIAARALQGVGAAVMMALTMAFVGDIVPKEQTGAAMGLLGTMSAVGTALGPTLGGMLIAGFAWPAIFLMNLPLGALTLQLAWAYLPGDRPLERKAAPFIRLEMLRHPVLGAGFAMNALVTTVVMATLMVGPFYLPAAFGLDAARVGLVMSCGPLVSALTGVPAGRVVDRFGARRVAVGGLTVMATGAALLALLPASLGVGGYVVPLALTTAGYAIFQAANNTAVMTAVAAEQRGVASGLLTLSRNLGLVAGASLMGTVFALAGMHLTFALATALVGAALLIAKARE